VDVDEGDTFQNIFTFSFIHFEDFSTECKMDLGGENNEMIIFVSLLNTRNVRKKII